MTHTHRSSGKAIEWKWRIFTFHIFHSRKTIHAICVHDSSLCSWVASSSVAAAITACFPPHLRLNVFAPMCANMRSELVSGPLYKYPCFVIESACERVISSSMRSTSASISYISSFSSFDGVFLAKSQIKLSNREIRKRKTAKINMYICIYYLGKSW